MVEQVVSREADEIDFDDPLSELDDRESSPPTYEIATYPADFTLEVLYSKWKNDDLLIPKFQRGFVWSQNQASKLIESFLVGLPVPAIFLYTERAGERSLVVDMDNSACARFSISSRATSALRRKANGRSFWLTGLSEDSPYANKTYADLVSGDEAASRRLRDSVLRALVVRQLDPADDTSVFHILSV